MSLHTRCVPYKCWCEAALGSRLHKRAHPRDCSRSVGPWSAAAVDITTCVIVEISWGARPSGRGSHDTTQLAGWHGVMQKTKSPLLACQARKNFTDTTGMLYARPAARQGSCFALDTGGPARR
jgi:hypothetical protein